jgi:signal peptidase I
MKYISAKLIGSSMEPLLKIGDVLLVKKVPFDQLAVGNIVVFENEAGSMLITHRILSFHPDGALMTKPDATLIHADFLPVRQHKVVGKVIAAYRGTQEVAIENSGEFVRFAHRLLAWLNNSDIFLWVKSSKWLRWVSVSIIWIRRRVLNMKRTDNYVIS